MCMQSCCRLYGTYACPPPPSMDSTHRAQKGSYIHPAWTAHVELKRVHTYSINEAQEQIPSNSRGTHSHTVWWEISFATYVRTLAGLRRSLVRFNILSQRCMHVFHFVQSIIQDTGCSVRNCTKCTLHKIIPLYTIAAMQCHRNKQVHFLQMPREAYNALCARSCEVDGSSLGWRTASHTSSSRKGTQKFFKRHTCLETKTRARTEQRRKVNNGQSIFLWERGKGKKVKQQIKCPATTTSCYESMMHGTTWTKAKIKHCPTALPRRK